MTYNVLLQDRPRRDPSFDRFWPVHAAMIGNFPPRVCGISTFTCDLLGGLSKASSGTRWTIAAMNDRDSGAYDFPDAVTHVIAQDSPDAYLKAADFINRSGAEVAFVQHEFGIFGGPAGAHLLRLLRRLKMPVIVTLHTVLERPDPEQRRVMDEILRNAAAVIVMAEKGATLLDTVYQAPSERVHVIPHGAPSCPLRPTEPFKARLGFGGRKTIMTFGLLSPNKGLETIIAGLPHIVERHPDVLYLIVGATHPNLVAREGEAYRQSLVELAGKLNVSGNVRFINRFVGDDELIDLLQASDVYATPYLTETQITSGTLSYAIALGRPIVSTPYWHAAEALGGGVGVLCGFGDSACFAREISSLLGDDARRGDLAERAWRAGIPSRWSNVGKAYMAIAGAVVSARAEAGGPL
jgi:glycosyltransferase involved in cell wall biosynthesis